jgi:hypothetical protein
MNKKFKLLLNKEKLIILFKAVGFYGQKLEKDLKTADKEAELHKISNVAERLYSISSKIEQFAREYSEFENRT